ncbi:MAG: cytochrome c [Betaproteobacteria bacterium]|nr:cytochrome c [Betaproteobacteria bacterium]
MNRKLLSAGLVFALGAGYALTASSQVKPETLVKERQAVMTLQGKYFDNSLRLMARGTLPYDASVVARNAVFLDALIKMPWDGFDPSTKDITSRAAPAVFTDTSKFKEARDLTQSEISKLVAISKGGDEAAVKAQINAVNKACGTCHESFRTRRR